MLRKKAIRRIWKLPYRTHNNLLHLIYLCLPFDVTLEKYSTKYKWNLINGENKFYGSMVKLSLSNNSTTLYRFRILVSSLISLYIVCSIITLYICTCCAVVVYFFCLPIFFI